MMAEVIQRATEPGGGQGPLPPGVGRADAQTVGDAAARFREALESAKTRAEARQAAEQLVSTAFIKPALEMLREGNQAPPPWGPGPGEKQFGPLLDQRIADEVVSAAGYPLVDRVAASLDRTRAGEPSGPVEHGRGTARVEHSIEGRQAEHGLAGPSVGHALDGRIGGAR